MTAALPMEGGVGACGNANQATSPLSSAVRSRHVLVLRWSLNCNIPFFARCGRRMGRSRAAHELVLGACESVPDVAHRFATRLDTFA